jgi:hypothetical protein
MHECNCPIDKQSLPYYDPMTATNRCWGCGGEIKKQSAAAQKKLNKQQKQAAAATTTAAA